MHSQLKSKNKLGCICIYMYKNGATFIANPLWSHCLPLIADNAGTLPSLAKHSRLVELVIIVIIVVC